MRGRTYLVSGFTILAVALLAAGTWVGFTIKGFVNSIEDFRTLGLPAESVIWLGQKHYVLYYESHASYAPAWNAPRVSVSISSEATGRAVWIPPYASSLSYNLGDAQGVAEYTANPPRAGRYFVRASSEVPGGNLVIGESIAALGTRDILRGLLALLIFFGVGGIGVLFLTLHDRQARKLEQLDAAEP